MTLLAAFMGNQDSVRKQDEHDPRIPMLVGDFLLSRLGAEDEHKAIPTMLQPDLERRLPPGYLRTITGLAQKIYKINPQFAIGWTGSIVAAKSVLNDLFDEFADKLASGDEVLSWLEDNVDVGKLDLTLVGWAGKDSLSLFKFSNSPRKKEKDTGKPYFMGSGAENFLKLIERKGSPPAYQYREEGKSPLDVVKFVNGCAGEVLMREIFTEEGLQDLYGGGFQIIYHNGVEFVYFEDITFLFGFINIYADKYDIKFARGLIKYKLIDDVVIAQRTFSPKDKSLFHVLNKKKFVEEQNIFQIPGLIDKQSINIIYPKILPNRSMHYCISFKADKAGTDIYAMSTMQSTGQRLIEFKGIGSRERIFFHKKFLEMLNDYVEAMQKQWF